MKITKKQREKILQHCSGFNLEIRYKSKPSSFEQKLNFLENGDRDYCYIATHNGINGLSKKQKRYIIDIHITEDDIVNLVLKKIKQKKLDKFPDEIR